MKHILPVFLCIGLASVAVSKTPSTAQPTARPMTDVASTRAQTSVTVFRPVSEPGARRPVMQGVNRPQTTVEVSRPQTAQAQYPHTQVEVLHPSTTVEVIHPQTTVEVIHPQTLPVQEEPAHASQVGGKTSAKGTTSMSDFTPKPAKDFTAAQSSSQKAAQLGGGTMNLGNANADQAAKDAAAKSSLLGAQNNQNMDVNSKQNNVKGLEKLLTDRAKVKEKK